MANRDLDAVDRKIIALLQTNGRMANLEIARHLGVAEGTVRKRLERLISEGLVRIAAIVDPALFGFRVHTIIGVQADPTMASEIAGKISSLPEVLAVHLTAGGHDILVEAALPSNEALLSFVSRQLGAIPGVRRTEMYQVLRVFKRARDWRIPDLHDAEKPRKILVVDDDPAFVRGTKAILAHGGYTVISASNGSEGLQKAREERPDLIVLDYTIDSLAGGATVTSALKEDEALRETPILMVSAVGRRQPWWQVQPDVRGLRVDGWLDKPVDADSLVGEVTRLLAR